MKTGTIPANLRLLDFDRDRMAGMAPLSHAHSESRQASMARRSQAERRRSLVVLVAVLLIWSVCLGMGMARATDPATAESIPPDAIAQATPASQPEAETTGAIGTVDAVPPRFQTGQKLYLENCASCHIGIPPAVMPSQTWQQLVQDPEHYGVTIQPLVAPNIQILWQYLREYSRPLAEGESTPYRIQQSRIFRILHPRVKFTEPITLTSCVSCHPGAGAYDFRSLTAEWQNAP